jgi:hypothetical protein
VAAAPASDARGLSSSTVAAIRPVRGSIRETLASPVATQTPESINAIAAGSRATAIVSPTRLVAGSIRQTVAS